MKIQEITKNNYFSAISDQEMPWQKDYLAMYSSQWPGITTDPHLMSIPVDDHLVHRGDGVFDVMRCVHGKIYQMEQHLSRLEKSARAISLDFPPAYKGIRKLIKHLVVLGAEKDCLIRIVISRGPGSFSPNPFDCPSSHIYINVNRFHSLPEKCYSEGVSMVTSRIPIKKSFFANIKSCDYLPNVLMKMEAINAGADYSVALDEEGNLAEGAVENIGVVTNEGFLKFPRFERVLSGITVKRVSELAEKIAGDGIIKEVRFEKIPPEEAYRAKELFLTGTSLNIVPVVQYDGVKVGQGVPGRVYSELSAILWKDMTENRDLLTDIDWP